MSEPAADEVVAETAIGKFRIRGTDSIFILVLVIVAVNAAFMYMHMDDARRASMSVAETNKEVARTLAETNREMSGAIREGVKAQRLSTCILATDQDKREKEYMKADSFCNRVSQ